MPFCKKKTPNVDPGTNPGTNPGTATQRARVRRYLTQPPGFDSQEI